MEQEHKSNNTKRDRNVASAQGGRAHAGAVHSRASLKLRQKKMSPAAGVARRRHGVAANAMHKKLEKTYELSRKEVLREKLTEKAQHRLRPVDAREMHPSPLRAQNKTVGVQGRKAYLAGTQPIARSGSFVGARMLPTTMTPRSNAVVSQTPPAAYAPSATTIHGIAPRRNVVEDIARPPRQSSKLPARRVSYGELIARRREQEQEKMAPMEAPVPQHTVTTHGKAADEVADDQSTANDGGLLTVAATGQPVRVRYSGRPRRSSLASARRPGARRGLFLFLPNIAQKVKRLTRRQGAIYAMAVTVFVLGVGVSLWGWQTNKKVEQSTSGVASAMAVANTDDDGSAPSTDEPTDKQVRSYTVAADMPRYISIAKIGVKARVKTMGLTADGAVQAPNNVYDAGWYSGSSLPGSTGGASFIDGHVSSWTTAGVFKNLHKLTAGDIVKIELGSGEIISYQVVRTESVAVNEIDMQKVLSPVTSGKAGLNLMTCDGDVRDGTSEFEDRLVVYTERI